MDLIVPLSISVAYEERLLAHIAAVRVFGRMVGVPELQLVQHDLSKWQPEEYAAYALQFCGDGAPGDAFDRAWIHHIHNNPHHWEHWIIPASGKLLRMPDEYVYEMIADWMGANRVYAGHDDMSDWLSKNWGRIRLHDEARITAAGCLRYWGYRDIVDAEG